jgi:hypothetical protein
MDGLKREGGISRREKDPAFLWGNSALK